MARTVIKPDPIQAMMPISSGDTVVIDDGSESTVTDAEGVDEGYHTNHENKKDGRTPLADSITRNTESSLDVVGRGVKALVQAVQDLRHLGVEDLDLPLPRIVVVGDQSTGKSSLIEGITEIKVPRQAGTCTRCPMEINITESGSDEQWKCKISLHKKYVYEGKLTTTRVLNKSSLRSEGATKARPLGPWTLQDSEDFEFATVYSKDDVARTIYLAQLATLNPGSPHERYLPNAQPQDQHQVKFSPNIIRIDISGPDLPNLSFYDLPGVINVSEIAEEEYLVDLVKNLVKQYITAPDCINLLALPMTDDPANSSASRLVREVKAECRTIGCLTKPDRIQQGEPLDQWLEILGGHRFRLGYGYHVIKNNPNTAIDHLTARREEDVFFSTQEPWATILRAHAGRFGTPQLQKALSQRLTAQIRLSLPRITEQVQLKGEHLCGQLSELPEPLDGNLAVSVMGELIRFERLIQQHIDGGLRLSNSFQKDWNLVAIKLRQDLGDTRPVLTFPSLQTPQHSQSSQANTNGTPTPTARNMAAIPIDSDDSDDNEPSPISQRLGQKRPPPAMYATPKKLQRSAASPTTIKAKSGSSKKFSLREVQSIMQDAYTGLPGQVDPKALETMIKLSMAHWEIPLNRFLNETRRLCQDMVFEQIQEVYSKYSDTQYYEVIRTICEEFFDRAFLEQRQLGARILSWEQANPKTYNDEGFDSARAKALTLLQTRRHEIRASLYLNEHEMGKPSAGQARIDKAAKLTDDQLGPDPYRTAIIAMSTVKGYYECAMFRFVDVLSASVQCELFTKCRNDIVGEMRNKFALTEPGVEDRLAVLLAANPEQEQRRSQLKKEMETIIKAQERLEGLKGDE